MCKSIKVLHIITSLEYGGAQELLYRLALGNNKHLDCSIISLFDGGGPYKSMLEENGIKVITVDSSNLLTIMKLIINHYHSYKPKIVQTWMYHADFIGLILSIISKKHKLVWSLHHADPKKNKLLTKVIVTICKCFSKSIPDRIVACSYKTYDSHIEYGYSKKNMVVIENGVNFNKFTRSPVQYNYKDKPIIIGNIARWHPIKGQKYFIKMASDLIRLDDDYIFVMVGTNMDWDNNELVSLLDNYGVREKFYLLGERDDISSILNIFDIFVSSSVDESFSLSLVEAIACRVLSISTNTGIAEEVLANDICIVDNPKNLSNSVLSLMSMTEDKISTIKNESFNLAKNKFNEQKMLDNYYALYQTLNN
jgi:glycosyltransferase involved in cell wall biosynthesis